MQEINSWFPLGVGIDDLMGGVGLREKSPDYLNYIEKTLPECGACGFKVLGNHQGVIWMALSNYQYDTEDYLKVTPDDLSLLVTNFDGISQFLESEA